MLARSVMSPVELGQRNPNLVGGDINGGAQILSQMFTRPTLRTYSLHLMDLSFAHPQRLRVAASTVCAVITRHVSHYRLVGQRQFLAARYPAPSAFVACSKGDTIMKGDIVVIGTARPVDKS